MTPDPHAAMQKVEAHIVALERLSALQVEPLDLSAWENVRAVLAGVAAGAEEQQPDVCAECSPPPSNVPGPPDPPGPPRGVCPHCRRRLSYAEAVCSRCHPYGVAAPAREEPRA